MKKRNKVYLISLYKKDKIYANITCATDQTILDAAEEHGIVLPYSCRAGSCSACVGKLLSGTVNQHDQNFLERAQIDSGYVLTCIASPTSEISIQTHQEENLY